MVAGSHGISKTHSCMMSEHRPDSFFKRIIKMKRLVINTFSNIVVKDDDAINTDDYKIGHCVGCTHCWLKTPGVCAVKDDWEILFKRIISADTVVFITEAKLGFVSHKMKNIVDRLIPIATPYTTLYKGEMCICRRR